MSNATAVSRPGTDGLWLFVCIDMGVFLAIFLTFALEQSAHASQYAAARLQLNPGFGLVNTLILLTSSWMVVEAVHAARSGAAAKTHRHLTVALLLGLAFVVSKIIEYTLEIRAGITPITNSFFSYYFFITFGHLMHVLAGTLCIAYVRGAAPTRAGTAQYQAGLENVGLFWHFVDVVWLYIFPMLYLVGRA